MQVLSVDSGIKIPGIGPQVKKAPAAASNFFFSIPPMVVIAVRVVAAAFSLFKSIVRIAGMVHQHQACHQFYFPVVQAFQQRIKIIHAAEVFHDAPVIADIGAIVSIGRFVQGV